MTDKEDDTLDTGSATPGDRIIGVDFGEYTVKVRLGDANEFLGIIEIGVNRDFRSLRQRIDSTGSHDISDFYDL